MPPDAPDPARATRRLRPKRATIIDVAREAGVAASTVSRSFTDPARVNHVTRDHILEVAERLGYTPNPSARALGSGRLDTIALLVPDITNPYFAGAIKGAERGAAAAGLTMILGDTQERASVEESLIKRLGPAVDGFVLAASRMPDPTLADVGRQDAVVLINRSAQGLPGVVADYDTGTQQIIDHLASLGHTGCVFAGGPAESWSGSRRWQGLQRAAAQRGMAVVRHGPYIPVLDSGAAAADAALGVGATAVVCHNDLLAIGVLRRLAERGVGVPQDVSVVGFDDVFGADFCHPPLTTLAEATLTAGERAVEVLAQQVRQRAEAPAQIVLPTRLKVRASTGAARRSPGGRR